MRFTNCLILSSVLLAYACGNQADQHTASAIPVADTVEILPMAHPEWSKNATIYEVNLRQHTPEGTLNAFAKDLPRLKQMGIDILWLMPVFPIGEENRKGGLGSYYSVKDYVKINPEFGSLTDLKNLVNKAHELEMKVILDWVANHSAWDHPWVSSHPEWYTRDSLGNMVPPVADWSDVADLNFDNAEMRHAMIEAMRFWVKEADVDGFRCDVASMVPTDFWNEVRVSLDSLKPMFMLAEAEDPAHHEKAFNMSYSWELLHIMNQIAKGEKTPEALDTYMAKEDSLFPGHAYRMSFTTNHDENSWNGTVFERYGDAHELFAVLAFTLNGMPLVYSGQEAALDKALRFFDKDTIDWKDYPLQDFYSRLLKLNQQNPALWNGLDGGSYHRYQTSDPEVFAYARKKGDHEVITVLNFSSEKKTFAIKEPITGEYKSIFNDLLLTVFTKDDITIRAHGYQVYAR